MELLDFFRKESKIPISRLVWVSAVAGISNSLLLGVINMAAENVANQVIEMHLFLIYLVAFVMYAYSQRYVMLNMTLNIERMVRDMRIRIANKIQKVELRYLENTGREALYSTLQQQTNFIAQMALQLSITIGAFFLLIVTMIYLGIISVSSLLMVIVGLAILLPFHIRNNYRAHKKLNQSIKQQNHLFTGINHLLEGFKEVKFSHVKAKAIEEDLDRMATESLNSRLDAAELEITVFTFIRLAFFVLLALLAFVLPAFTPAYADQIYKIVATMLFIMAPLNMMVASVPIINRANTSVTLLYDLEQELDLARETYSTEKPPSFAPFKQINLNDVEFEYRSVEDEVLFSIGKLNLEINQGEILFIVGGNGSGKSTLLKVLSGLYQPTSGQLFVDDNLISKQTVQSYRELFATVMTDFHLFDRLYGIGDVDEEQIQALLKEMELQHKTQFVDGRFTNISLSSGQRKRLAFIVAYLEHKQIYMFDEFAADQDPHFRQYFYEVVLQRLKKEGKSVIAVTHDDKYFNWADRVVKMDYGQLVPYEDHLH